MVAHGLPQSLEASSPYKIALHGGTAVLDLDYAEDSTAETDANFVMTGSGGIIEVQGTAEGEPFSQDMLLQLLGLANGGIKTLVEMQKAALA